MNITPPSTTLLLSAAAAMMLHSQAAAQAARIREETRVIATYPFSEPDPVPMLTRDRRLYPYHSFEGYAYAARPREWKVVRLENDLVEVFILPQVGGKVWGAVVKKNGHEFIYRNEVLKFRNIAARGRRAASNSTSASSGTRLRRRRPWTTCCARTTMAA